MHFICLRPVDCSASLGGLLISPDSGCFIFLGMFQPAPGHGQVSGARILMQTLPEHIAGSLLHAHSYPGAQPAACRCHMCPSNAACSGLSEAWCPVRMQAVLVRTSALTRIALRVSCASSA